MGNLTVSERDRISAEMLEFLRRHVIDVWFPRCIDREAGGFLCDFDRRWKPSGPQHRMLEFQARQTRAAARLALEFPNESQWAETALHGFRYLRDKMWDHQHGGWYRLLARDGRPLDEGSKHGHGTAYAVQSCALVYLATCDAGALELAKAGFDWFDRHAYDDEYGGYQGWLRRDGTVIRPGDINGVDPLEHDIGLKDVNVHGDWIEALTDFLSIHSDSAICRRLEDLLQLFLDHFVTNKGALHSACEQDWRAEPALERYGYHFQAVQRFLRASEFLAQADAFRSAAQRLMDHAISRSSAGESGGFWQAGPGGEPTELEGMALVVKRRVWWTQCEALRALALFSLRENPTRPEYRELFRKQWDFVRDRMSDRSFGGLYATCPDDLPPRQRPFGRWRNGPALQKGNIWKDASHETDCLVACIRLLSRERRPAFTSSEGLPSNSRLP